MAKLDRACFACTSTGPNLEERMELAVLADRLGFGAMILGEHIVLPAGAPSVYMPNAGSDPTKAVGLPRSVYDRTSIFTDLVATIGAMAYATQRIKLVTGIYLATLRHPLMTASSVATLQELAKGRFHLGVGVGWNQGEYEALGGNFAERGSVLDETIDIIKAAMHGGPIEYHGRHYSFEPVTLTQDPFTAPILFGGHSTPALRRAARVGDGWMSSLSNDVNELVELTRKIDALRAEMGTADRPFQHWIKLMTIDPTEIERLQRLGIHHFQLLGEPIWGPKDASFKDRAQRMREVATALRLDQG
jgi:probable F420-dependent oxidoreductase